MFTIHALPQQVDPRKDEDRMEDRLGFPFISQQPKECTSSLMNWVEITSESNFHYSINISLIHPEKNTVTPLYTLLLRKSIRKCLSNGNYILHMDNGNSSTYIPSIQISIHQQNQFIPILKTIPSNQSKDIPFQINQQTLISSFQNNQKSIISSSECARFEVGITLRFIMNTEYSSCSFQLKNKNSGRIILSSSDSPFHSGSNLFTLCLSPTLYQLTIGKNDISGWKGNYVDLILPDQIILIHNTLDRGLSTITWDVNLSYGIFPLFSSWEYNFDGNSIPASWTTSDSTTASWPSSNPGSFPSWLSITQYYVSSFTVSSLDLYSFLRVSCKVYAGAVVYVNGYEIGRVHMPTGEITSQTSAEQSFLTPTTVSFVVSVIESYILLTNRIAIELHAKDSYEQSTSFDASALFLLKSFEQNVLFHGMGVSSPSSSSITSLFDLNPSSIYISQGSCVDTTVSWYYSNHYEKVNHYSILTHSTCMENYPSSWSFEGSNNRNDWVLLHRQDHISFTPSTRKDFYFFNPSIYSSYRLRIEACDSLPMSNCSTNSLYIADLQLYSKHTVPECFDELFPPSIVGEYSYLPCPPYSIGYQSLFCTRKGFENYNNTCWPLKPSRIVYPDSKVTCIIQEEMEPFIPLIEAWSFSTTIYPALPKGLKLQSSTGIISGTPTSLSKKTVYTITVSNLKGSITTTLQLEVIRKANLSGVVVLIVLTVVFLLICLVIYFVRVIRSQHKVRVLEKQKNIVN